MFTDDLRSVDYLASRPDVDPDRLGCCGLSVGGFRSAHLAGLDLRLKVAVVVGWMCSYPTMLKSHLTSIGFWATVPGLQGRVDPDFPPFDMDITDAHRADIFISKLKAFERDGQLPRLTILRLPRDHTAGTRPGSNSPRAMVADNDAALGRVFDAISHSRYWKESAIFVLEDDAQNGPDHVDAHRSVLLMASPYARRGAVDSTLYTTSSVLRTIELILGLPPMSQYDAAATPLYAAFATTTDLTPFHALPARVSLEERNREDAPGAEASLRMNLSVPDRAPERELNEVIWKSVRGRDAVMPAPVRAAFVRPLPQREADDDDDDDDR
jgi:hypothetical protein